MFRVRKGVMFKVISLLCLICIFSSNFADAQINNDLPNPIRIGVRDAAYQIAYDIRPPSSAEGFCGVFGRLLKEGINRDVVYRDIENQYLDNSIHGRFDGLRIGAKSRTDGVDIECGPNSESVKNTSVAEGIDFSRSFYSTGIKLLMKEPLAQEINQNPERLKEYFIGYVKNTTTPDRLTKIEGLRLKPYPTRDQALNALESEIKIYASDAIILRTLLKQGVAERRDGDKKLLREGRAAYEADDYTMFPYQPGKYITGNETTENYVVAISKNTAYSIALMNAINDTLARDELDIEEHKNLKEYENQQPFFTPPWWQTLPPWLQFLVAGLVSIVIIFGVRLAFKFFKGRRISTITSQSPSSPQNSSLQNQIHVHNHNHQANQPSMSNSSQVNEGDTYNVGQSAATGKYARSNNNTFIQSEQKQTLAEAAAEIQRLLKQLGQTNPNATEIDKMTYVNDETTPSFKRRVAGALQAGGEAAIEEFLDNPYVNVGKAVVKGWIKPE
jgi:hypothetical protein